MIFISEALALAQVATGDANNPLILWDNIVTIDNVTADSEEADYPATNLANPSTTPQQGWRSDSTAVQYLTVTLSTTGSISEYGVARHNFGTGLIGFTPEVLSADDGVTWTAMDDERLVANDDPIVGRFVASTGLGFRLKLRPTGSTKPRAAALSLGSALVFDQGVEIGDVPLRFGRQRNIVTGLSHSGDFLGRIITGGTKRSRVSIRFIDPEWFRSNVDRFLDAGIGTAFFYVAEPSRRPNEVGYVWLTSEPNPPVAYGGGALDLTLDIEGIL